MAKKRFAKAKAPKALVIIFIMIILAAVLTYIIPAGQYGDMVDPSTGRTVTDPNSYTRVEQNPTGLLDVFKAIPQGLINGTSVISIVLVYGAAFGIINSTQIFELSLSHSVNGLRKYSLVIIPIISIITSLLGAFMGLSESCFTFIPLCVLIANTMGYDAVVGYGMCMMANCLGFTAGPMNYWTVGIAQGIAELPLYSGLGLRLVMYAGFMIIGIGYLVIYARRIRKDPTRSVLYGCDELDRAALETAAEKSEKDLPPFTTRKKIVLAIICVGFACLIYFLAFKGWSDGSKIGGYLLLVAIIAAIVDGRSLNDIADGFVQGARSVLLGALMVGTARAILIILENGMVVDTILYACVSLLSKMPKALAAVCIYIFQFFFNFLVPSGSGQASVTMPLIIPLSDMLGITRQTAVIAFQLGDGFSNILWPTTASMAGLGIAGVPYKNWLKFFWPILIAGFVFSILVVLYSVTVGLGPF